MNWQKKLNKAERQHFFFATNGRPTLTVFKENRTAQKQLDAQKEVCFDCRKIAQKLGIE